MKTKTTSFIRLLSACLLLWIGTSQAWAWDSEPDSNGKYDELFDRPTYFPDWEQPSTWPNAMYYRCEVHQGHNGPVLENYEIAVYDQEGALRHCQRSIARDDHHCVLTIRGTEGETFHFQVIYGSDFQNPVIVDVPSLECAFQTNVIVGSGDPFVIDIPGRTFLDEHDTELPAAEAGVDVTVRRTIKGGEWGTICLPFAMTAEQIATAFGPDTKLGDFQGCDVTYANEDEEIVQSIKVKFESVTAMEANRPYIIKVQNDVTAFSVDGVDVNPVAKPEVKRDKVKTLYNRFIGNYQDQFLVPAQCLFLSSGKFYYSAGKTQMMAYRAYFDFYDLLPEAENASARISLTIDDEISAVPSVAMPSQPKDQAASFYDLQGRKVSPTQLKRGFYIQNNKKIFVR